MAEFTEEQQEDFEIIELEKKRYDMVTTFIDEFWDYINKANEEAIIQLKNKIIYKGF